MRGIVAIGKTERLHHFAVRVLAAIVSGFLLWLSQFTGAWGMLAWISLVPLLWATCEVGPMQAALLGFFAGMVGFGLAGEWALLFGVHAWLALTSVLSLYMAGFAGIVAFARRGTAFGLIWIAPSAWILMDWARTRFPVGGIGLAQLGYSQVDLIWGRLAVWGRDSRLRLSSGSKRRGRRAGRDLAGRFGGKKGEGLAGGGRCCSPSHWRRCAGVAGPEDVFSWRDEDRSYPALRRESGS